MLRLKFVSAFVLAFALKLRADEEILIIPPEVEALLSTEPEVPEPECPENEQFLYCKKGCATCSDRFCRIPGCVPGCGCKRNHYRIEPNGTCVPVNQCPVTECGENEVFLHCGPVCEFCGPFRCKQIDCTYQCFCKPGYVRNASRICIPEIECPKPETCSFHEVMSSPSRTDENCWDEASNETVDEERCNCLPNHRRSKTGICINENNCPETQCDITETYYDCVPQCNTTCSNYEEVDCTEEEEFCYSACFCSRGLVMNDEGFCVRYEECNQKPNESSTFEILARAFKIHFTQTIGIVDLNDSSQTQESDEDELLRAQVVKQNSKNDEDEGGEKEEETEETDPLESTDGVGDQMEDHELVEMKENDDDEREVLQSATNEENEDGVVNGKREASEVLANEDEIDGVSEADDTTSKNGHEAEAITLVEGDVMHEEDVSSDAVATKDDEETPPDVGAKDDDIAAEKVDDMTPEKDSNESPQDDDDTELHKAEYVENDGISTILIESENKNETANKNTAESDNNDGDATNKDDDVINDQDDDRNDNDGSTNNANDDINDDDGNINNGDGGINNDDGSVNNDDGSVNNDDGSVNNADGSVNNNDGSGNDDDDNKSNDDGSGNDEDDNKSNDDGDSEIHDKGMNNDESELNPDKEMPEADDSSTDDDIEIFEEEIINSVRDVEEINDIIDQIIDQEINSDDEKEYEQKMPQSVHSDRIESGGNAAVLDNAGDMEAMHQDDERDESTRFNCDCYFKDEDSDGGISNKNASRNLIEGEILQQRKDIYNDEISKDEEYESVEKAALFTHDDVEFQEEIGN